MIEPVVDKRASKKRMRKPCLSLISAPRTTSSVPSVPRRKSSGHPMPRIPPAHDVRRLVKEGIDKRGRPVGRFESRRKAKEERRHRIQVLVKQLDVASARLATTLEACGKDKRLCGSMACPHCARRRRFVHSAPLLAFLAKYPLADLRFVTLISPEDAIPAGQLHAFDARKLVNRTRRQLERLGIDKTQVFLIGAIDGEWDAGWNVFQPHSHWISWRITEAHLKALVMKWPSDERVRVRKRLEPIDDLPRVVAYLDKSFWPAVARKDNPAGIDPHGKRRPPAHIEAEVLHWLHQQNPQQLRLMYGAKLHGRLVMKT